jgi:hypothetical protein
MKIASQVAPSEALGRGVFSGSVARRARRHIRYHVFLERAGEIRLSVDRLDIAPPARAIAIAARVGTGRGGVFYGWAVVSAGRAAMSGRRVIATPLPDDNPYHADIILPDAASSDREEQKRHAQELRDAASWRDRDEHPSARSVQRA